MSFNSLLESMNSTCCLTLQSAINKFIQTRLPCRDLFIMFLSEYANECVIQVVNDVVLEQEFRFSLDFSKCFTNLEAAGIFSGQWMTNYSEQGRQVSSKFDLRSAKSAEKDKEIDLWLMEKLISLCPNLESFLKVPINHPENNSKIIFYVCLVEPAYTFENDEYNFSTSVTRCLDVCSAILLNAFTVKEEKQLKDIHEKLLAIARANLLQTGDRNQTLSEIMTEARKLTNAERCSLFILSEDKKTAKIYDEENSSHTPLTVVDHGILGYVAAYGETVVIQKAQTPPFITKNADILPDFKIRNLLCFPVRGTEHHVVGVVALFNKARDMDFTYWDEVAAGGFGIYFGVAILQGILHRKIQINKAQDILSFELITHHLTRRDPDFEHAMHCRENHNYDEMLDFHWIPRNVGYSDTICYIVRMFDDLGLTKLWKIPRKTLVTFTLAVRRGYRDLPYHNWEHGFSVAQFAYYLIHELKLLQNILITGLEAIAFLVAALCHDLDHRGTTNGFQILSESCLASLYESEGSVLERHHFSHMLTLLNAEDCNIFENLTVEQYSRALSLIRNMIVATDLAEYVKTLPKERSMSIKGYSPEKKTDRNLLLSLMMTCCDLNDQLKGWSHCRNIAELIYSEFFLQGDMEKELGSDPLPSMDRERAFIPELQLEFLTGICIPCYTVLSNIFPNMKPCVDSIEDTFRRWERAIEWLHINEIPKHLFSNYIFDPSLDEFVLEL